VFIPPAWKLNSSSIKVLEKLGFRLAEEQEEYLLLLSQQEYKKIKLPKVLNWDSTGHPEKNVVNMARDERAFKLDMEERPQIIRIGYCILCLWTCIIITIIISSIQKNGIKF